MPATRNKWNHSRAGVNVHLLAAAGPDLEHFLAATLNILYPAGKETRRNNDPGPW